MIDDIKKFRQTESAHFDYSILIPTWNNLDYLELCVNSIRKNSSLNFQIIVLVNEGKDKTLEWLCMQSDVDYVHAKKNIGICYGLNICRSMVKSEYIIYLNDDMYVLPDWEKRLMEQITKIGTKAFLMSSTMIEPHDTGNNCVVVNDYGQDIAHFDEEKLLKEFEGLAIQDWNGSTWPPNIVHIDMWDIVGGLSPEFSPGMYSDPDYAKKLFDGGVRIFKGCGNSLVYHFGSKSTKRVRRNTGRRTFILKWGLSSRVFMTKYLFLGQPFKGVLKEPQLSKMTNLINRLKRVINC